MAKNVDILLEDLFQEKNIIAKAKKLKNLVEVISTKKDKKIYINQFFEKLDKEYNQMIKENDFGFTGYEAEINYFYCFITACRYYEANICLEQMKRIGNIIIDSFYNDENPFNIITKEKVEEIIDYLDVKYEFFEKFGYFIYSIIDYKNKFCDSLLGINRMPKLENTEYNIFLFKSKDEEVPIYIFFHEIGHYIHSNMTNTEFSIPKFVEKKLEKANIYLNKYDKNEKSDILALVLAIGLMYDSPYKEYEYFYTIPDEHKQIFSELTNEILVLRNKVNMVIN